MTIQPEELKQNGYVLSAELEHNNPIPFLRQYIKKWNPFTIFFWAWNILLGLALIYFLFTKTDLLFIRKIDKLFLGIFLTLLLLPIHELIHGLVYKMCGAPKVTFKAVWRKFIFYAIADKFVTDNDEFYLVAVSPFAVINISLILTTFLVSEPVSWILFGALIFHTGGCFGDFALLSYFYENKENETVTYDDVPNGKSYFYAKKK